MKTAFWLVLIALIAAGVIFGQDWVDQGPPSSDFFENNQPELPLDTEADDADSLLADAVNRAFVEIETGRLDESDAESDVGVKYAIVDTSSVPADVLAVIERTKKHRASMVFEGEPGFQYVYIALGQRMTGGYQISVDSVKQVNDRVIVRYREIGPGKDDFVTQAITYPWVVLKVNSDLPIDVVAADSGFGDATN